MILDEIEKQLADLATCGDPQFVQAAQYVQQLIVQVQTSQLSSQDMKELLLDVERSMAVIEDAGQLVLKECLTEILTKLLDAADIIVTVNALK